MNGQVGCAPRGLLVETAPNKSLDASGTTWLVIDNLSVTWLTAAASTQSLAGFARVAECGSGVTRYDHRGSLIRDTERALVRIGAKTNERTMRANYG